MNHSTYMYIHVQQCLHYDIVYVYLYISVSEASNSLFEF